MPEPNPVRPAAPTRFLPGEITEIGLIAGNRSLPLLFARQAREMGIGRIVAVAFENETDPALADCVDRIEWIRVGQLNRMIQAFTNAGIGHCVMAGQIAPKNLFDLRPDLRAVRLLARVRERNAHTLFGAIADELQKDGVTLIPAVPWLKPLMPGPDLHLGPACSQSEIADIEFGFRIAKEISRLDVGQSVVVKEGTVLAVEGFEGTDACLKRGGSLAGRHGNAVAVKVAKVNHDLRFDIPCVGPATVAACSAGGVRVLAFEARQSLLLEPDEMKRLARKHRVTVRTIDVPGPGE